MKKTNFISNTCGCGLPAKYYTFSDVTASQGSCNKYGRCMSYDDLLAEQRRLTKDLVKYYKALTKIVEVDGMDYEYKAWAKAAIAEDSK